MSSNSLIQSPQDAIAFLSECTGEEFSEAIVSGRLVMPAQNFLQLRFTEVSNGRAEAIAEFDPKVGGNGYKNLHSGLGAAWLDGVTGVAFQTTLGHGVLATTSNLHLNVFDRMRPLSGGQVIVEAELERIDGPLGYVEGRIWDLERQNMLAKATATMFILEKRPVKPSVLHSLRDAFVPHADYKSNAISEFGKHLQFSMDRGVVTMPVLPEYMNYLGTMNGGVIAAAIDEAATNRLQSLEIFAPEGYKYLTTSLDVNFERPIRPHHGDLVVKPRRVSGGNSVKTVLVDVGYWDPANPSDFVASGSSQVGFTAYPVAAAHCDI